MNIWRHARATSEIIRLDGKHRTIWESVLQFERLLAAGITSGHDRVPGLKLQRADSPAQIYKARVIHPQLGGKSSGLRYVYERLVIDGEEYSVALTVYLHQSGIDERDVIERIRSRFAECDGTKLGLRGFDRSDVG